MTSPFPFVSIVIPTLARAKELMGCLRALVGLDYPHDRFEVLVVDDGGCIPLGEEVARFQEQFDLRLLRQRHAGPAVARNTGAAVARGDYLAFTDDDCMPSPDWLRALAVRFAATPDCAIGGTVLNALRGNPYATASQLLLDRLYGYYNADPANARLLVSSNLALPKRQFREVGGFDTSFPAIAGGEDRELCDRWRFRGFAMAYVTEARVYHAHAVTLSGFWRQHFNYGRGAFHFHRVRARRGQGRVQLEPAAFYRMLLRRPPEPESRWQVSILGGLLGLSQVANAAGYAWERMRCLAFRRV